MRILIQRVSRATLSIDGREYSHIDGGLPVFAGVEADDGDDDIAWLAGKLLRLRIFDDAEGVMNLGCRGPYTNASWRACAPRSGARSPRGCSAPT